MSDAIVTLRRIVIMLGIATVGLSLLANAATIRRETQVAVPPDLAWAAVRDVGRVDQRLARGFIAATTFEGNTRTVTFANGRVVREVITGIDDAARRLAYSAVGGRAAHHAASLQVLPDGSGSRLVWITDVLPDSLDVPIGTLMDEGIAAMKRTLEADARPTAQTR